MIHAIETPSPANEVADLATRCAEHNAAYKHNAGNDDSSTSQPIPQQHPCFELFRLALSEANAEAWQVITEAYGKRVRSWVRSHPHLDQADEDLDYFVNGAFTRLWQYAGPHMKAGRLSNLGQCLQYLKTCAWTEIQNHLRKQTTINRHYAPWVDEEDLDADTPSEQHAVIEQLHRQVNEQLADENRERELRATLNSLAELMRQTIQNDQERLVVAETWEYGLPPREIYARHPDRFADVTAINLTLRNVLRRLQRHPQIKRLLQE